MELKKIITILSSAKFFSVTCLLICIYTLYIFVAYATISETSQCEKYNNYNNYNNSKQFNNTIEENECKKFNKSTFLLTTILGIIYLILSVCCTSISILYICKNKNKMHIVLNDPSENKYTSLSCLINFIFWIVQTCYLSIFINKVKNNLPFSINDQSNMFIEYIIIFVCFHAFTYYIIYILVYILCVFQHETNKKKKIM